jgi:hypothetical protein
MTTPPTTTPIGWTEIRPGREYRVHTPIGDFDAWNFGPNHAQAWFVADADSGVTRWHGPSFERALDAIRTVVEETQ